MSHFFHIYMPQEFVWYPHTATNPYIRELHSFTDTTLIFNGYFYLEPETLPVERIFFTNTDPTSRSTHSYHIEILEKHSGEDTSVCGPYDEEVGGHICFFPTEIITLHYRIIQKDLSHDEIREICQRLEDGEEEETARNDVYKRARQQREYEDSMLDYAAANKNET